jgi:hypothetical protein
MDDRRHLYLGDDACVFDRLLAAGISLNRIEEHCRAGLVLLDGEVVTDSYRGAPPKSSTLFLEIP